MTRGSFARGRRGHIPHGRLTLALRNGALACAVAALALLLPTIGPPPVTRADRIAPHPETAGPDADMHFFGYRLSEIWSDDPQSAYETLEWPAGHEAGGLSTDLAAGVLAVVDRTDASVRLYSLSAATGAASLDSWPVEPSLIVDLGEPRDVALLDDGGMAVSDGDPERVAIFDSEGAHTADWEVPDPYGLAYENGRLYAVSGRLARVVELDLVTGQERAFEAPGLLQSPQQLSVRRGGDMGHLILDVFDPAVGNPVAVSPDLEPERLRVLRIPGLQAGMYWDPATIPASGRPMWIGGAPFWGLAASHTTNEAIAARVAFDGVQDVARGPGVGLFASVEPHGPINIPDVRYFFPEIAFGGDLLTMGVGALGHPRVIGAGQRVVIGSGSSTLLGNSVNSWSRTGDWLGQVRFQGGLPPPGSTLPAPQANNRLGQLIDVAASGNLQALVTASGIVATFDGHELIDEWAAPPPAWARGISASGDRLVIGELISQQVTIFDDRLSVLHQWEMSPGPLRDISDLALAADRVYVVDRHASALETWSLDGTLLAEKRVPGGPRRVAVDPAGNVLVLTDTEWVLAYSPDGALVGMFSVAYGEGRASDIAVGDDGRLYVADPWRSNHISRRDEPWGVRVYDRYSAPPVVEPIVTEGECINLATKRVHPDQVPPGRPVTIELWIDSHCVKQQRSIDVVLSVDVSSSMIGSKLASAKDAAIRFIIRMDPAATRIGAVSFDNVVADVSPLTDAFRDLMGGIVGLRAGGGTNIVDGLRRALEVMLEGGERAGAQRVIVFMSDGNHSVADPPLSDLTDVVAAVRAASIEVFAIGLGQDADPIVLRQIATSSDHVFLSPDEEELGAIYEQIADILGAREVMTSAVLTDRLPPNMEFVVGSGVPIEPVVSPDGRVLTWELGIVVEPGFRLSYQVRPTEIGTWPTNEEAFVTYGEEGAPQRLEFPVPVVRVELPTPTPTRTATLTPTATISPTATASSTSTVEPTASSTATPTATATAVPPPTASLTASPTPSATPSATPTELPSATVTSTASRTAMPGPLFLPRTEIARCHPTRGRVAIVLVMDVSSSMAAPVVDGGPSKAEAAVVAATAFLRALRSGHDRVAVVAFDEFPTDVAPLTTDLDFVAVALTHLVLGRGTRVDRALERAAHVLQGASDGSERAVVLLTDGRTAGGSEAQALSAATALRDAGVLAFTIGLGTDLDTELLRRLATTPAHYRQSPQGAEMTAIYEQIARELPCR